MYKRGCYLTKFLLRKPERKIDIIDCPCDHSIMVSFHIVIEATAGSDRGTRLNSKFTASYLSRIILGGVILRSCHLNYDIARRIAQGSLKHPHGGLFLLGKVARAACHDKYGSD